MSQLRICAIIPTHDHVTALDTILSRLDEQSLPVIVIDDGSAVENGERIAAICARHAEADCQRHAFNGGKGFAVMCGLARAKERGFTHAIQIDADGQHDLQYLGALLGKARTNPDAIVTGVPQYDTSLPFMRRIWRPFTNFWVHVNTLSLSIPDAMCGFRVYPFLHAQTCSGGCAWPAHGFRYRGSGQGILGAIPIEHVPVRVTYPIGNFSNFDLFRDSLCSR